MSTTIVKTREELLARREELLRIVRMNQQELYERAETYTLTQDEHNIYETVRSINYLLGDD